MARSRTSQLPRPGDIRRAEDAADRGAWAAALSARAPSGTVRSLLVDVTGRWGAVTVLALTDGTARFGVLRRRIDGVSEKMLSQTLRVLERDGLVDREIISTSPLHVEYTLSALGSRIAEQLQALTQVLNAVVPQVLAAQGAYDFTGTGTGTGTGSESVCSETSRGRR